MRSPRNGRIRFGRRSGQRIWLRSVLRLAQTGARQVTISTCPLPRETGALGRGVTPRCGADLLRSRTSVGSPWQQDCLYMHDTHGRQHMPALYAHHLLTVRWHGSRRAPRVQRGWPSVSTAFRQPADVRTLDQNRALLDSAQTDLEVADSRWLGMTPNGLPVRHS